MVTWKRNLFGKIKMRLDGKDMMVPEKDCVWTKKDGELHHIHTLGKGFSLFEFEDLTGSFEERLQQVKDNREAALEDFPTITNDPGGPENLEQMPVVDNNANDDEHLEEFPKVTKTKIIFPREDAYDFPESTWRQKVAEAESKKPKKSTKDWLFG